MWLGDESHVRDICHTRDSGVVFLFLENCAITKPVNSTQVEYKMLKLNDVRFLELQVEKRQEP